MRKAKQNQIDKRGKQEKNPKINKQTQNTINHINLIIFTKHYVSLVVF